MGVATSLFRKATKNVWVRVMNRAGRLVGFAVDTSADAPEAGYQPKRDLYSKMAEEGAFEGKTN